MDENLSIFHWGGLMLKRVSVIGHFGFGEIHLGGQTVKTKVITKELEKRLGEDQVKKYDTHGGKRVLLRMLARALNALRNSENVVMLPAHGGVKFFAPVLTWFNFLYKRKLFYIVIGGWLPEYLKTKPVLRHCLKKFNGIFVETNTMQKDLQELGFENVYVMPNCKELRILPSEGLTYSIEEPYRLCTFSRVMKEKGIEDAVKAVKLVNGRRNRTVYTLDIYGQIDEEQKEWFEKLQVQFPECVRYCGVVGYDKSVETLKDYFALLFPTKYFTEGIPGTIIDAYAAGVPVISSRWGNFSDIIEEGTTGFGYEFNNNEELIQILERVLADPRLILNMKKSCLEESKKYLPETVLELLVEKLIK